MRSGMWSVVVASVCSLMTSSLVASAEQARVATAPKGPAKGDSEVVATEDLALGQPAPEPSAPVARATAPAPTEAVATVPSAPGQSVTSPTLASTAVISNGTQTTAVVDLRLLPKQLPYRGEQAMDGYVLDERRRWWMIVTGGALFGVGYVAAIATANDGDFENNLGYALIPIAGPWMAMAMHEDRCSNDAVCLDDDANRAQLAAVGILQLAGAILLPIGLVNTKQVWLREDLSVGITPTRVGRTGYGAVLSGSF